MGLTFFVKIYLRTLRQLRMLFCVEMHEDLPEWGHGQIIK
jgi:superfamily I DNA and RNA helicase